MKATMTLDEIIDITKSSLFASRESIEDALEYCERVAKASDNPGAVLTAVGVLMNAISDQLKQYRDNQQKTNFDQLEAIVNGWIITKESV